VFEHQQALNEHDRENAEKTDAVRQENRELRQRLHLPPRESPRSDRRPAPMYWPASASGVRASPRAAAHALMDVQRQDEHSRDPPQCTYTPAAQQTTITNSTTPATMEGGGTLMSSMDTDQSIFATMATAGSEEPAGVDFGRFELWPAWTEKRKNYHDKITEERKKQQNQVQDQTPAVATTPRSLENVNYPLYSRLLCSPTSGPRLTWSLLFIVVLGFEMVAFPLQVFEPPETSLYMALKYLAISFWTVDLVLSFFVGYYTRDGTLQMRPAKITQHYIKTWFVPDFLIVIIDWILLAGVEGKSAVLQAGKALRYLRVLRIIRILRLRKLVEAMHRIDEMVNSQYLSILKSILLNMLGIVLISHFLGCLWYALATVNHNIYPNWAQHYGFDLDPWVYQYLTSLHWSLTQFTPGSMSVQPQNEVERAFAIIVLVLGVIVFSSIISSITAATNSLKNMNAKYEKQIWMLRRFFKEQHISRGLVSRVVRYADSSLKLKHKKVQQHEVDMLGMLPQSLYMDVMLELHDQYLAEHPLFAALLQTNRNIMQKLCCHALREIILSEGDELFVAGQIAHAMYFVVNGELNYAMKHFPNQKDVDSNVVTQKHFFVEAVLWTPWVHQGRMKALMESDLLAIDSKQFAEEVGKFHSDVWVPQKYGAEFVKRMNEMAGFDNESPDDDIILSDLLKIESCKTLLCEMGLLQTHQWGDW